MSDGDLATRILRFVHTALGELEAEIAPGLRLPRIFGGHLVRSDARADLLYVLALLIDAGTEWVGGVDLRLRAHELVLELDPAEVEGFYSYRVAEAVGLLGGLSALSPSGLQNAAAASRSPLLIRDIAEDPSRRNRNFIVVAARCLHALERLGLAADGPQERHVREQTFELFYGASGGWINDGRPGYLQFDIYTPEMYLLAEPFADRLEPHWHAGLRRLLDDLEKLCQPTGVITWGRSVGALANAMSLELVPLAHRFGSNPSWWLGVGQDAAVDLQGWFRSGLVAAHQARASDSYRGPARRLQITFDLLGKMAWSARRLRDVREPLPTHPEVWPDVDELIPFAGGAAAWTHRSRSLSFVLPLMAGRSADYLPSPRFPGLFEQPVDGFPLLVPTVIALMGTTPEQMHFVPAGAPTQIAHDRSCLEVRHVGWAPVGATATTPRLGGSRTAIYRITGRSLEVHEHVRVEDLPDGGALTLAVGEVPGRSVRVEVDLPLRLTRVETAGMAEWRTHWSELERVHQIDIEQRQLTDIRFSWKVTPDLLIATTEPHHQYSRSLYEAIPDATVIPAGLPDGDLARRLRSVDVLHVAWPERWVGLDPDASRHAIEQLRAAGVRIVWTQHNVLPHRDQSEAARRTYSLWAEAADGIIHHSHYGKQIALAFHRYRRARHYVIPHGHWGSYFPTVTPDRSSVEVEEGWPSASIRLAIIGQPRREKSLQAVVDAVAESDREDIQLVARLSVETRVPPDPRIIATYGHLGAARYYRRLTAVDGVILPFHGDTMLTTGTALDCIGGGIAAVSSPWGFLRETFGDSAIWYGGTQEDLVACLSSLTPETLHAAGSASRALQPLHDWRVIGEQTFRAFEDIVLQGSS